MYRDIAAIIRCETVAHISFHHYLFIARQYLNVWGQCQRLLYILLCCSTFIFDYRTGWLYGWVTFICLRFISHHHVSVIYFLLLFLWSVVRDIYPDFDLVIRDNGNKWTIENLMIYILYLHVCYSGILSAFSINITAEMCSTFLKENNTPLF